LEVTGINAKGWLNKPNANDKKLGWNTQGIDEEGNRVIVSKNNKTQKQKWNVIYVDEAKIEPTKGLNKDYGF
jgi:hypothetical protein